ncbi:MAG: hypothetical protein WB755_02850 [Terriglobales bacterium]
MSLSNEPLGAENRANQVQVKQVRVTHAQVTRRRLPADKACNLKPAHIEVRAALV